MSSLNDKLTHIEEIVYLRGFSILAVIAIHTSGYFSKVSTPNLTVIINLVIGVFSHFAVPMFIFISGFVLSLKYRENIHKINFVKKRMKSIVPQYLIFSFVYLIMKEFHTLYASLLGLPSVSGVSERLSIGIILFKLLTGSSCFHLWFIILIIQFYLLYPFIIKVYTKYSQKNSIMLLMLIAYFTQVIWEIYILDLNNRASLNLQFINYIYLPSYTFYFIAGIYFSQHFEAIMSMISKYKINIVVLSIIIILTVVSSYLTFEIYYGSLNETHPYSSLILIFISPIYYSSICLILITIARKLTRQNTVYSVTIHRFGEYSFGIYLIHGVFLYCILALLNVFGVTPKSFIFYPLYTIMVTGLSYTSVCLLNRLPLGSYVIGQSRKSN
ncbi:acyltransferase [Methanosarcina sp. KYL-1]|uniref:acyltransferase n=1 Tax=Methanosarcina sp. KYL-1 TaxID=2602068 RepID=UPI0021018689|nr:acyltransferase [Methanosarcina sp. KYL-1]MCQ1535230.1 acyltransferase [Methanosarcina sp. KYL-1]